MKKMNVIVVFDKNLEKTLMCKRTKEPYIGMYNLVGGKIEKRASAIRQYLKYRLHYLKAAMG